MIPSYSYSSHINPYHFYSISITVKEDQPQTQSPLYRITRGWTIKVSSSAGADVDDADDEVPRKEEERGPGCCCSSRDCAGRPRGQPLNHSRGDCANGC